MADIKISQLGAAIAVGDTDLLPIVSGGNTLKATAAQVKEHSIGNTNISSIGDGSVTGAINALNTDKQPKTLDTPLTIGGVSKTTVEAALGGLVSENQTLTQDVSTNATAIQATRDSIAPTEDGTNYSKSYTKGAQFYRNGVLYEVTASSVNTSTAINTGSGGNAKAATIVTTNIKRLSEILVKMHYTGTTSANGNLAVLTANQAARYKIVLATCKASSDSTPYVASPYSYGKSYDIESSVGISVMSDTASRVAIVNIAVEGYVFMIDTQYLDVKTLS